MKIKIILNEFEQTSQILTSKFMLSSSHLVTKYELNTLELKLNLFNLQAELKLVKHKLNSI